MMTELVMRDKKRETEREKVTHSANSTMQQPSILIEWLVLLEQTLWVYLPDRECPVVVPITTIQYKLAFLQHNTT